MKTRAVEDGAADMPLYAAKRRPVPDAQPRRRAESARSKQRKPVHAAKRDEPPARPRAAAVRGEVVCACAQCCGGVCGAAAERTVAGM